jgi:hypothetical protein
MQSTGENFMIFFVLQSDVSVTIHNSTIVMPAQSSFFVPPRAFLVTILFVLLSWGVFFRRKLVLSCEFDGGARNAHVHADPDALVVLLNLSCTIWVFFCNIFATQRLN